MIRRFAFAVVLASVIAGTSAAISPAVAAGPSCDSLAALKLPDTTITAASPVDAGPFNAPGASPAAAPLQVPAFCRVTATIKPSAESHINIEVWLPSASDWNGQFLGTGNGGAGGVIVYGALASGVRKGFAVTNTDLGTTTTGLDMSFGIGHPELQKDWAYRATHLMTVVAKEITSRYYGRKPTVAYFTGCSTGGHQAIAEARQYPEDYDGIVAGAPAYETVRVGVLAAWNWMVTHEDPESTIPAAKIPAIRRAVVEACDGIDGIKDDVIDDPRRCAFDPMTLVCAGGDAADCLTRKQAIALKRIYQGPTNPRTGKPIVAGTPRGSEANVRGLELYAGPSLSIGGFFEWASNWKGPKFDVDRDLDTVRKDLSFTDYSDPHLDAFRTRGGKLLVYSGWADPIVTPGDIVSYYEGLQKAMGGPVETAKFARLFMLPGMGHCRAGDGPSSFDPLAALAPWVEKGIAPDQFTASLVAKGQTVRTRPICAYPQYARWNGTGSTDAAANFTCVTR